RRAGRRDGGRAGTGPGAGRPLPAPGLRRPAAALLHRPRTRGRARAHHLRRGGLRPRRLGAGRGAQPAQGALREQRRRTGVRLPRPARHRVHRRRADRDVPRCGRRTRRHRRRAAPLQAPLHPQAGRRLSHHRPAHRTARGGGGMSGELWRTHGWWVRRLAMLPVHLFLFAAVVFFVVRMIPGDPIATISGGQPMTPEQVAEARASLGLDGSLLEQLGRYLGNVLTLDFGNSIVDSTPVLDEMGRRLPETLELALLAMVISTVLTLALGLFVVARPRNV